MIVSELAHLSKQLQSNPKFEQALDFLQREGWRDCADGKISIEDDRVYALLQSYATKTPNVTVPFEGHRQYVDIQYVIEGKETIYCKPTSGLSPTTPYDESKDIWFCQSSLENASAVVLNAGQLAVLFPEDAHAPTHAAGTPLHVRKVVVKVAV